MKQFVQTNKKNVCTNKKTPKNLQIQKKAVPLHRN